MAMANSAGVESMGIGMEMGLNTEIGMGHSLASTRTHSLPSTDPSENAVENTIEPSRLHQQQQQQQKLDMQQLQLQQQQKLDIQQLQLQQQQLHSQQLQLEQQQLYDEQLQLQQQQQQQIQDAAQHVQQSRLVKSAPAPPKQLSSPQQNQQQQRQRINGVLARGPEANADGAALDAHSNVGDESMRELEDLLTKLNPLAKEFVPPSHSDAGSTALPATSSSSKASTRRKNGYNNRGKRRANNRTSRAHLENCIRRTVYVSDIDQQVTEEQLAALFITCGQVVDCRVCGDPNSFIRFAFVEFTDEDGARAALSLAGTILGYYPVRVLPSKTAIVPVNPPFLPRSEDEREMCSRTIYCTNIDNKVSQPDVKLFFECLCGEVARLRLLADYHHSTRMAFVEFVRAEGAMAALNCSGAILGSLPIRVSPSKTPVRPRSPRPHINPHK